MSVTYTNSPLATENCNFGTKNSNPRDQYYKDTKKCYNPSGEITLIIPHHMAGVMSAKQCAQMHYKSNGSSANYYIGKDGEICLAVDESRRAWTSGDRGADSNGITIEVSNSINYAPWKVSDKVFDSLVNLCADICKRNGIKKLNFTGDTKGNLLMHRYFQKTACPGDYLAGKFPELEQRVNAILNGEVKEEAKPVGTSQTYFEYTVKRGDSLSKIAKSYKVELSDILALNPQIKNPNLISVGQIIKIPTKQNTITKPEFIPYKIKVNAKGGLNVRAKAGTSKDCKIIRCLANGSEHIIVAEQMANLAKWGQLSTGGWVCLLYTKKA